MLSQLTLQYSSHIVIFSTEEESHTRQKLQQCKSPTLRVKITTGLEAAFPNPREEKPWVITQTKSSNDPIAHSHSLPERLPNKKARKQNAGIVCLVFVFLLKKIRPIS
jgi:hypothetical protein